MNPLPKGFQYALTLPENGIVDPTVFDPIVEIIGPDHVVYYRFSLTKDAGQTGVESINTDLHCLDLETGDQITAWFSNSLSLLRSEAKLRRAVRFSPDSDLVYIFDNHKLYNAHGVRRSGSTKIDLDGTPITISTRCRQLLDVLLMAAGRVVTTKELAFSVYGIDDDGTKSGTIQALMGILMGYDDLLGQLIQSDRKKGYHYTGLLPVWYIGEIDDYFLQYLLEHVGHHKPHLISGCFMTLSSGVNFVERTELSQAISDAFLQPQQKHIVFLSGIGGIGKSEMARAYAKAAFDYGLYATAIPLCYSHVDSAYESALKNSDDFVSDGSDSTVHTDVKLKEDLLAAAGDDVLIVIDDFDVYDAAFLDDISRRTGNARVLITTRLGPSSEIQLSGQVVYIGIDKAQEDFSKSVFGRYAGVRETTSSEIDTIVQAIGYHTMLAALLGRYVSRQKTFAFPEITICRLANQMASLTWHQRLRASSSVIKDGVRISDSDYFEILKDLFSDVLQYEYSEIDRQVLGAAVMFTPMSLRSPQLFIELLGVNPGYSGTNEISESLTKLLDDGLLYLHDDNSVAIHPLITKLVLSKQIRSDGRQIADTTSGFRLHTLKNKLTADLTITDRPCNAYKLESLRSFMSAFPHQVACPKWESVPPEHYGWIVWDRLQHSKYEISDDSFDLDRLVQSIFLNQGGYYSEAEIKDVLLHTICGNKAFLQQDTGIELGTGYPYILYIVSGPYGRCMIMEDFYKGLRLCIANGSLYRHEGCNILDKDAPVDFAFGPLQSAKVFRIMWDNPPENVEEYSVKLDFQSGVKFYYKDAETTHCISCPVTEIASYASLAFPVAFSDIKFGNSLKTIYSSAFSKTAPLHINLPESLQDLHSLAFTAAASARIPYGVSIHDSLITPPLVVGRDLVLNSEKNLVYSEDYFLEERYRDDSIPESRLISPEGILRFPYVTMPFNQNCVVEIYDKQMDNLFIGSQEKAVEKESKNTRR